MAFALALMSWTAACGGGGGTTTPPPPPPLPVTVSVAPTSQNVLLGATQQFTPTLTNTTNTAVTWSVNGITGGNSTVGTIDVNGLYRGPAVLPSPAAVTIRATSVASPGSSGTATATVTSDVVVNITAPAANSNVELGATQQFNASVTSPGLGAPSTSVIWSVSGNGCAGAACGAISAAGGLFAAPGILPGTACSLPATGVNCVTVTATSVADPSKSATLTLHIVANFGFTINSPPGNPPAMDNATQFQFVPTFTRVPNSNPITSVTWSVSGAGCPGASTACGTIDMLTGLYTAPNQAPSPPSVTITGIPTADASKAQSPTVIINTIVIVAVSPATANVEIEGQQNFTANVGGPGVSQNVIWDVNGIVNGNSAVGSITNPGLGSTPAIYTAPISIPTIPIVVTATSVSNPAKSASVTLTFFSTISASLQPSGSTRAVNHRVTLFGGLLRTSTGTAPVANAVDWTVIDNQGNRFPGGNTTVGLICTVALIGCTPPGSTAAGNSQGDVDYLAPANIPSGQTVSIVSIEMRSQADTTRSALARVTVIPNVQISLSPSTSTLPPGQSQPFSANVVGTANQSLTWDVNGVVNGNSTLGQICVSGSNPCVPPSVPTPPNQSVEYRAPASVPTPNPVIVTATSSDDPTQSASGTVSIATGPFITKILPASITALPANGNSFTLKIQGINFTTSSVILFTPTGAATKQLTTNCTATPSECTATISVADVGAANRPPHPVVQIQNLGNVTSNAANLIVLDPATQQKDFASAPLIPISQPCITPTDAGCQNITVVEPTTIGSTGAAGQVNFNLIGVFSGSSCLASNSSITVLRPMSLSISVSICVVGTTNFSATDKFSISGPNPNDITAGVDANQVFPSFSVKLNLAIPFDAKTGPRTLFVETANHEKSAFVGAIEVK